MLFKHRSHRQCACDATVSRLISLQLIGDCWDCCNQLCPYLELGYDCDQSAIGFATCQRLIGNVSETVSRRYRDMLAICWERFVTSRWILGDWLQIINQNAAVVLSDSFAVSLLFFPGLRIIAIQLSRLMTKPTKWPVRPAKTQICLGIRPGWSESSLSAWRKLRSLATHWAHSEDWSDWARLGGCPGWSESSLGAHAILLVLSRGGSNDQTIKAWIVDVNFVNTCDKMIL